jgi:hypothetical protein
LDTQARGLADGWNVNVFAGQVVEYVCEQVCFHATTIPKNSAKCKKIFCKSALHIEKILYTEHIETANRRGSEMTKANTAAAKALGAIAYANGQPSAPALNSELQKMFIGRQVGDKRTIPEMKAYIQGWTAANLASTY